MTELVLAIGCALIILGAAFYQSYQSKQRWKRFSQREKSRTPAE